MDELIALYRLIHGFTSEEAMIHILKIITKDLQSNLEKGGGKLVTEVTHES